MELQIKRAIDFHNDNNDESLNQTKLGEKVLPEFPKKTAAWYISRWSKDKELSMLKPVHIIRICEVTGVDPNFLLNWYKFKNQEK